MQEHQLTKNLVQRWLLCVGELYPKYFGDCRSDLQIGDCAKVNSWFDPRAGDNKQRLVAECYIPKDEPRGIGAAVVYGDVAYLPNPSGQGMVLSLSGLWMTGTQSAGNFVLDGVQFSKWLNSIVRPDGTIPPFELLIGTKNLQGSATDSSIIAKRVSDK